MTLLLFLGLVVLLFYTLSLRDRINNLENDIRFIRTNYARSSNVTKDPPKVVNAEVGSDGVTSPPPKPAEETIYTPVHEGENVSLTSGQDEAVFSPKTVSESKEWAIYSWFKEQTLIKIGAMMLFLGVAWFVNYAIAEGWLSPTARIALGLMFAVLVYSVGLFRLRSQVTQGLVLTALGTGVVMVTVFASQMLYELFQPVFALIILVASVAYTVFVSLLSRTQWLALFAGSAGLVTPLIVNSPEPNAFILLMYLLVITVGFLTVVFFTQWRGLTLLFSIGNSLYLLQVLSSELLIDGLLWSFVILFSGLIVASASVSLMRSDNPNALDVGSFAVASLTFAFFANLLAISPGIAMFLASFLVSGVGYLFFQMGRPSSVVSIYVAFAGVGVLIGTTFLFSGFTLVLAYAIEVTFAFILVTYLRLSKRLVTSISILYLLPLLTSLQLWEDPAWRDGFVHVPSFTIASVIGCLLVSAGWVLSRGELRSEGWLKRLALFGAWVGYGYGFILFIMVGLSAPELSMSLDDGRVIKSADSVVTYIFWVGWVLVALFSAIVFRLSTRQISAILWTFLLPALVSLESLSSTTWNFGVFHADAFGSYVVLFGALMMAGLLWYVSHHNKKEFYLNASGFVLFGSIVYLFGIVWSFWLGIFSPNEALVSVARYVTYTVVLYLLAIIFMSGKLSFSKLKPIIVGFVLPALLAINSFYSVSWSEGVLHPDAAGLYVFITVVLMLAVGLRTQYMVDLKDGQSEVNLWSNGLFIVGGLYATGLVWVMSHSLAETEGAAIAIALFIYTIVGLLFYSLGKARGHNGFRRAGVILLFGVVLRLVLIDVWTMEMFWRFVTFAGLGTLFIVTALFEKPFQSEKVNDGGNDK